MTENIFYATLCHVCKEYNEYLKRCAKCKMVAYCSKKHQTEDWPQHKGLCKIIACTNASITYNVGCDKREWKQHRIALQTAWSAALERELLPHECQMWMFPRVCAVCFSKENLTDCRNCLNVSYCSTHHEELSRNAHLLICKSLKLCMDVDRYLLKKITYPNFNKNFGKALDLFPKDIQSLMKNYFNEVANESNLDDHVEFILKTEIIAPGATILYALEKTGIRKSSKNKLVIHLAGASSMEVFLDWQVISEFLFHWLDDVTVLDWIFVGPEMFELPIKEHQNYSEFCQSCSANSKTFFLNVHNAKYHEVVDIIPKPDLVVAFNSGLHEFEGQDCDSWTESIPSLLKYSDIPLVLTAYTKSEITQDLNRVMHLPGVKLQVVLNELNPFASMRSLRDWTSDDTIVPSVFYVNGFISIVKRAK